LSGGIHSLRSGQALPTTAKYVWEGNGYYSPLIYSMLGGAWRYHLYDGLGSTRQLMLHASPYTVTDTYSYEAFGNLLSSTGTTPNPYKYVGSLGYYQTGSSLMHLGARYYMPEVGRFLQRDPLWDLASPYVYVDGSPTSSVDPDGLKKRRGKVEIDWLCVESCKLANPVCVCCQWWNLICHWACNRTCKKLCTILVDVKPPNPPWRKCVDRSTDYEECHQECCALGGGAFCSAACDERFKQPRAR